MDEPADIVREHYGRGAIVTRVLAAVRAAGGDPTALTADALYPYDQLHGRELHATREHAELLRVGKGSRVLDVGAGIGGPARYVAHTMGARVSGIDLTPDFVDAARELTRRCGLDTRVDFHLGDALAMPFGEASFDAALCLYASMNILDKARLAKEMARVLVRGGRLVWSQVVLGAGPPPTFPLPWARDAASSFLCTADELRALVVDAGFDVETWKDETSLFLAARPAPLTNERAAVNQVVMGDDFLEARKSFGENLAAGRIASVVLVGVKR